MAFAKRSEVNTFMGSNPIPSANLIGVSHFLSLLAEWRGRGCQPEAIPEYILGRRKHSQPEDVSGMR